MTEKQFNIIMLTLNRIETRITDMEDKKTDTAKGIKEMDSKLVSIQKDIERLKNMQEQVNQIKLDMKCIREEGVM